MKKVKYRQNVTWNYGDGSAASGRGDYYLKMPHEFPSSSNTQYPDKADDMNKANEYRPSGGQGQGHGLQEIQDAATRLQNLLPRQNPSPPSINGNPREVVVQKRLPTSPARVVNIQRSSPIYQHHQEYQEPEVNIENQPYRTTPLVLPHAKTIHDNSNHPGNKYISSVRDPQDQTPYRSSSLLMPGPKTIHEVKVGGPSFQPYRGPQYYADKGYVPVPVQVQATQYYADTNLVTKPLSNVYNSPVGLYGDEALAEALPSPSLNSEGGHGEQDLINQELTPIAVTPNMANNKIYKIPSKAGGHPQINQSSSFKKVMYSVMRDSEF